MSEKPSTRHQLLACLCTALLFCSASYGATPTDSAELLQQRKLFRQAWQAAGRGDWPQVARLERQLGDYILSPYLRAEQLSQAPQLLKPDELADFLQRHSDWSFAPRLERQFLRHLGKSQQDASLLRHGAASSDLQVRCYSLLARIRQGADHSLIPAAQSLWLKGESLPRQCDDVFRWLQQQGGITPQLAWQRAELALNQGNPGLARYMRNFLNNDEREWLLRWVELERQPKNQLRASLRWPDSERAREIVSWAMNRYASKEVDEASELWPTLQQHYQFNATQLAQVERELALFRSVRLNPDAISRIDALPAAQRDDQILAWRARAALAQGNWQETLNSIDAMGRSSKQDQRWRYWRGRSLEALQLGSLEEAYGHLAGEANYHGFLAADRMQQAYAICPEPSPEQAEWRQRIEQIPSLQRALELRAVGLEQHARNTWRSATRGISGEARLAAAALARDAGWIDQAILTLASGATMRHYDWRFPREYQDQVLPQAHLQGIEPALVYGIIRAESALRRDAISGVGARGLMQLMPATARQVAQRLGQKYPGEKALLEPEHNLRLGTAYFSELLNRFTGSPMLAAGAYNAGPHIVAKWLRERPQVPAADIWPETVPYHETREYIPNVLAYSVIYEWLLEGQVTPLSQRLALAYPSEQGLLSARANTDTAAVARKAVACPLNLQASTAP